MRIIHLATVACVASLPYAASWSWGVKSSDDKEGVADASLEGTAHDDNDDGDPLISKFPDLITWFRNGGGIIDERITIGYEPGTNIRGMIASAPIPAGTLLIHTPGSLVLSGPNDNQCSIIQVIVDEMKLGEDSKWHLYIEVDDSSGSRIPSQWSKTGRAIKELQGLPPSSDTHRHIDWYQSVCLEGKEMTDIHWNAFKMFLTRAADIGLVPVYDLMNHHNGKINTSLERDESGGLKVYATDDIAENHPIYNTYARSGIESTVDTFNTYGFVEDYPQLWRWSDQNLVELTRENNNHAQGRYGEVDYFDHLRLEPNTDHYEVLVVTPTLAALHPSKHLTHALGNAQRTIEKWETLIRSHHANLRTSHANELRDSATLIMNELPTTIEEDESLILSEKARLDKVAKLGRIDMDKAAAIQAIEYRLAFKRALRLTIETAERETFLIEKEL